MAQACQNKASTGGARYPCHGTQLDSDDNGLTHTHGTDWLVITPSQGSNWIDCLFNRETAVSFSMPDESVNVVGWTDSNSDEDHPAF